MPRKRALENVTATVPPTEVAPALENAAIGVLDAPKQRPEGFNINAFKNRPLEQHDSLHGVTDALGATYWTRNKRFDWARRVNRHHFDFTRFYSKQSVLVDVFPLVNASTRKEVEQRCKSIAKYNETAKTPIGYLAVSRGAQIPPEAFVAVLAGEVLPLIEKATEGVLA